MTIDAGGIIRSANLCAVTMFGYTRPADLIGQNVNVLCPHPYKEQHDAYIRHYHRSGVPKVIGACGLGVSLQTDTPEFSPFYGGPGHCWP